MRCERDELAYLGHLLACDGAETEWHFNGEYRITIDYKGRRYDAYSQIDGKVCFIGVWDNYCRHCGRRFEDECD